MIPSNDTVDIDSPSLLVLELLGDEGDDESSIMAAKAGASLGGEVGEASAQDGFEDGELE